MRPNGQPPPFFEIDSIKIKRMSVLVEFGPIWSNLVELFRFECHPDSRRVFFFEGRFILAFIKKVTSNYLESSIARSAVFHSALRTLHSALIFIPSFYHRGAFL